MKNDHKLVQGTRPDHWVLFPPGLFWGLVVWFIVLSGCFYPIIVLTTGEEWHWGQGAWALAIIAFFASAIYSVERNARAEKDE